MTAASAAAEVVANIGPPELLIVLAVVLVLFGGSQLPKLARSLGQAQKEFKAGLSDSEKRGSDKESASSGSDTADSKSE